MKVYLAALIYNDFREGSSLWGRLNDHEKSIVKHVPHVLDSYHYVHKPRLVERIRGTGKKIFLDSGAFSAFTQGVEIDIDRYCEYILENDDFIQVASVLDAIGDVDQTWRNQMYMEEQGAYPLPCFHYGEPDEALQWYVEHYDYITLGGMVPISSPQLRLWLDRIWDRYLTDAEGRPKLKVHGFGLTSVPLMTRYPWFSVDSSSWVQLGGVGNIFLPEHGLISVSPAAPQRKEVNKHIDSLKPEHRKVVLQIIEELGFDLDRLRASHESRKVFNMLSYGTVMAENTKSETFRAPQPTLFR